MNTEPIVDATNLTRNHKSGQQVIHSIDDVSLRIEHGEIVAVTGPSGSGKSTLLHLLAGLDQPDKGVARVAGTDWRTLHGKARARFRRRTCGFVPQGLTILPQVTVAENVEVPLLLDGVDRNERQSRVKAALAEVELTAEASKLPDQLSGGQQQRVAIARALIAKPSVILADEPTGSLDSQTAQVVTQLLVRAATEHDIAVVLVTHDPAVAQHAHRIIRLRSGRIEDPETGAL